MTASLKVGIFYELKYLISRGMVSMCSQLTFLLTTLKIRTMIRMKTATPAIKPVIHFAHTIVPKGRRSGS